MAGWIKVDRGITNHWIWSDSEKLKWWLDILFAVNHADKKVNVGMSLIECKRGQSIRSLDGWAKRWGVSKSRVNRFFLLLKNDSMIETISIQRTTRLTVCNYASYQDVRNDSETTAKRCRNDAETIPSHKQEYKEVKNIRSKEDIKRSSNEDPKITKSNPLENGDLKNSEKPNNLPKEPKSEKEKSSAKKEKVDFRAKLIEIGVTEQTADDWLQVRRTKRATNTATALNKILEQLRLAYKAGYSPEECIRIATERDWRGFEYEWMVNLKNTSNGTTPTNRQPHARPTDNERREGYAAALNEIVNGSDPTTTPIL